MENSNQIQFDNEVRQKQKRIYGALLNLASLPKTRVKSESSNGVQTEITIKNEQEYVPDFRLVWCPLKLHFRVYILVADTKNDKTNAGYCICTVGSGLAAVGFVTMYSFIHKHRANNKGDAV